MTDNDNHYKIINGDTKEIIVLGPKLSEEELARRADIYVYNLLNDTVMTDTLKLREGTLHPESKAVTQAAIDLMSQMCAELMGGEVLSFESNNNFDELVDEETRYAISTKGYGSKHDDEHGLHHLLNLAYKYLEQNRIVEAGVLIKAAIRWAVRNGKY